LALFYDAKLDVMARPEFGRSEPGGATPISRKPNTIADLRKDSGPAIKQVCVQSDQSNCALMDVAEEDVYVRPAGEKLAYRQHQRIRFSPGAKS
jgi:hypothetical protein